MPGSIRPKSMSYNGYRKSKQKIASSRKGRLKDKCEEMRLSNISNSLPRNAGSGGVYPMVSWSQPQFKASPNPEQLPLPNFVATATRSWGSVCSSMSDSAFESNSTSIGPPSIGWENPNLMPCVTIMNGTCRCASKADVLTINLKKALMIS